MRKIVYIGWLMLLSLSTFAGSGKEMELEGKFYRVGGNGVSKLFVQSEHGRFELSVPNINLYKTCEKMLLTKMKEGYRKVRLINFIEVRTGGKFVVITLGSDSFCMLEGPRSEQ